MFLVCLVHPAWLINFLIPFILKNFIVDFDTEQMVIDQFQIENCQK